MGPLQDVEVGRSLAVEGENDDISGIGQTLAGQDLCQTLPHSMKANYLQEIVGHDGNGGDGAAPGSIRPIAFHLV